MERPQRHSLKLVVAATIIDTVGEGMFMPLTYLYFLLTTGISVLSIGAGMTAATLAALPVGFLAGFVVDRVGPKKMVVANNLVSAAGYASYLFVHNFPELVLAVFIVQAGDRLYWSAWPTLVADVAAPDEIDQVYATMAAARNGSVGAGYLLGGVLLGFSHGLLGAHLIVLANCASCLVAASLLGAFNNQGMAERLASHRNSNRQWKSMVLNKRFLQLSGGQALLAMAWLLPGVVLPVYLVHYLKMPRWLPSVALSVNFVLTTVFQSGITKIATPFRRTNVIATGGATMAASVAFLAVTKAGQPTSAVIFLTIAAIAFISIGMMLAGPTTSALAAVIAPPEHRGLFLSLFQQSWALSNVAGPVLVGWLLSAGAGWLWASMAIVLLTGATTFLFSAIGLPEEVNRPGGRKLADTMDGRVTNG